MAHGIALALRQLGTARTGAYFSLAPFAGAILAVLLLDETVGPSLVVAGALMAVGLWLHLKSGTTTTTRTTRWITTTATAMTTTTGTTTRRGSTRTHRTVTRTTTPGWSTGTRTTLTCTTATRIDTKTPAGQGRRGGDVVRAVRAGSGSGPVRQPAGRP
jgi:hypothetical protein